MHESLLLYIPSNNASKNIITKSFNILDSDPIRSRVEGHPTFSRYPGRANFPYISLENSSNRFCAKHRLVSAGTTRATRLAGQHFLLYGRSIGKVDLHITGLWFAQMFQIFLRILNVNMNANMNATFEVWPVNPSVWTDFERSGRPLFWDQ